jgi:hypothetical protein
MLILGAPIAVVACGLSERPYAERRQWPLLVPRPSGVAPRSGGMVLEMRELRAGPGLDARGLQTIQPDGSIRTAFYDEWAVPPARGVEDALRTWLASSGRFSAVVGTGSRAGADLALEGELTALWVDLVSKTAQAAIAFTVVDLRGAGRRIIKQTTLRATAAVTYLTEAGQVRAQLAALASLFADIEASMM